MAKQFASWIHGCAVVPEVMGNPPLEFPPDGGSFTDVNGRRTIFGGNFRIAPGRDNWFHAPIPTPAMVEDKFATLASVLVLFKIDGGRLDHIVVCEAANDIFDRTGLDISGDHLGTLVEGSNVFTINHDRIGFGICVSLHFTAFRDARADLHISAVGGNFNHDI
jgi:hypothetical protein